MKKLLSILLSALLAAAMLPFGALAETSSTEALLRDAGEETLVYGYYFEENEDISAWTNIDADGDGESWTLYPLAGSEYCYQGRGFILSYSYDAGALTPDNWLISPAVTLPAGESYLSVYIGGYGNYPRENFAIYAGEAPTIDAMREILPKSETNAAYVRYTADLSDFAGSEVYVAVRHFDSTDQNYLRVDNFEIWSRGGAEEPDPYAIHEVYVNGWGAPVAGVAGIDHMFLSTPEGAPYYLIYGGWRDETDQQQMWSEEHVFIPGHEYSEGCQIWAEEGYYFAEDCVFYGDGGTDMLDLQWCRVDENDNWICYMNSILMTCEASSDMLGDVDLDGDVDTADATLAIRCVLELEAFTEAQLANGDVNGDGAIDVIDAMIILRMALGFMSEPA